VSRVAEVDQVEVVGEPQVRASAAGAAIRWWLFPQVLSLDTAAIAACWQWLFARTFHVPVTSAVLFVTAACVWMIYAADHLLDVRHGAIYSARHRFIARHSRAFVVTAVVVFTIAAIVASGFPLSIWRGAVELTTIVGIYLAVVHCGRENVRRWWPKEFAIAAVFAVGSSIATWSSGLVNWRVWPSITLFAAVCTLNCCAVDYWEWQTNRVLLRYPHRATRWVARHLRWCAAATIAVCSLVMLLTPSVIILAVLLSTLMLMAVAARHTSLSPELARLLADAALLTPLLFLFR
jgi:hypothetical protein